MEGPLSKWTNVVHGWQYRWFILRDDALHYYTSREKMMKGQQRGCIRLRGAVIGIDGENNSLFTVTVDGITFHLQGRDESERNSWIRALEAVIHEQSGYYRVTSLNSPAVLKAKAIEADKHLQDMINEVRELEGLSTSANTEMKKTVDDLVKSANRLLDTVKHAVILLQMARSHLEGASILGLNVNGEGSEISEAKVIVPPLSYSSSEDEFFDAETPSDDDKFSQSDDNSNDIDNPGNGNNPGHNSNRNPGRKISQTRKKSIQEPDFADANADFDAAYEDAEEFDVGNVQQQHGSVLMHLLSQVSVGMDLTKVTLPTFILERRSLLEMYADFFAHPDSFVGCADASSPEERFVSVVRYYMGAFYAARKSGVAKKPYNPILGETFRCRWKIPGMKRTKQLTKRGPFPGSDRNDLTFIAEQVSHHPPVSAFYAEHPVKRVSFTGHIWTKSSFLGLSIGVTNIGWGTVKLHDYGEEYVLTFPNGYGRSIMSTPWIELGGKVTVNCVKTGYSAEIDFLTKPFFGGKAHRINGNIYRSGFKKPLLIIKGEWNGVITAKPLNAKQGDRESRRLWRHVTVALQKNNIQLATNAKRWIEQRQREEAKKRQDQRIVYHPTLFVKEGEGWKYKDELR
ncbi:Oxysterol binding protein, putative [Brugia malayi]|uniref:Oxysterol-binding protein n=1 Tax=Brugia malayi TaxID=6279 RepID=A0A4E9FIG5_BRUMA|nr:Oxysterol binding protein, putative [Brugia malayi]VIO96079.1 Oxysterol binding protein, putative [Brugia malayi]